METAKTELVERVPSEGWESTCAHLVVPVEGATGLRDFSKVLDKIGRRGHFGSSFLTEMELIMNIPTLPPKRMSDSPQVNQ